MADQDLVKAVMVTAELYGHAFTSETAKVFMADLSAYPPPAVIAALARCRKEVPRFPTISQVIERIDDGRPGPEEAWAMIPFDEGSSVVWCAEMAEAHGIARKLLPDKIAARLAFKEAYTKLLAEARAKGVPAKWTPSLGVDKTGQAAAIEEAFRKGRITADQAQALLPDFSAGKPAALLEGPEDPPADPARVKALIKDAFKQVRDAGGMNFLDPRRCKHELGPVIEQKEQTLGSRWEHQERACKEIPLRYLTIYRQCERCEAIVPENFPLKEGA